MGKYRDDYREKTSLFIALWIPVWDTNFWLTFSRSIRSILAFWISNSYKRIGKCHSCRIQDSFHTDSLNFIDLRRFFHWFSLVKMKSPKSPSPPNDLLVTAGFNLQIYHRLNPKKDHPKKTFSRFQVTTTQYQSKSYRFIFRIKSILEPGVETVLWSLPVLKRELLKSLILQVDWLILYDSYSINILRICESSFTFIQCSQ